MGDVKAISKALQRFLVRFAPQAFFVKNEAFPVMGGKNVTARKKQSITKRKIVGDVCCKDVEEVKAINSVLQGVLVTFP